MSADLPPVEQAAGAAAFASLCADESVGYLLARVRSLMSSEVQQLTQAHCQLNSSQSNTLMLVWRGVRNGADLARELGVDASAVTRLLDKLEQRGLVRRERSAADRRVVFVDLTNEGRDAVVAIKPLYTNVLERMLAGFTEDEADLLKSLLRKIISNHETGTGRLPPSRA